jgi:hypothetical protein
MNCVALALRETTTSVAFGDADGKGLYLTGIRSLYHIRLKRSAW